MKKILIIMIMLIIAGCSSNEGEVKTEKKVEKNLYDTIKIDVNLLNEQTDEYYVFLVVPGKIGVDGKATSINDFYGPIEVENFKAEIDLKYNNKVEYLLEELKEKKLQLVITTHEDYLIRNPLNQETFVNFEKGEDEYFKEYFSTQEKFSVDIVDKYPDGVLSLPWPEADFVVKLRFKEGFEPRHSYSVCLRERDETRPTGVTFFCPGSPLSNKSNYYNAVFYSDNFKNYKGQIEIIGEQPKRVNYENEPIFVEFDHQGKPIGDSVVEVIIE